MTDKKVCFIICMHLCLSVKLNILFTSLFCLRCILIISWLHLRCIPVTIVAPFFSWRKNRTPCISTRHTVFKSSAWHQPCKRSERLYVTRLGTHLGTRPAPARCQVWDLATGRHRGSKGTSGQCGQLLSALPGRRAPLALPFSPPFTRQL